MNRNVAIAAFSNPADISPFRPSRMRQLARGQIPDAPRAHPRRLRKLGVSLNYRGDPNVPENLSADIPDDENCSFWIRRLPANITVSTLLAAIRGIGRVYCTVITPPSPEQGWHLAAAKLVFFEEAAARRFWDRYGRDGQQQLPFVIGGLKAIVERNRTKVAESDYPQDRTRVLCVSGPEALVDVDALLREFEANFVFQMDDFLVTAETQHTFNGPLRIRRVEFRFGSFRCQAQSAYRLLYRRQGISIRYGRDPCDL
jgi:hypothetical protein